MAEPTGVHLEYCNPKSHLNSVRINHKNTIALPPHPITDTIMLRPLN